MKRAFLKVYFKGQDKPSIMGLPQEAGISITLKQLEMIKDNLGIVKLAGFVRHSEEVTGW